MTYDEAVICPGQLPPWWAEERTRLYVGLINAYAEATPRIMAELGRRHADLAIKSAMDVIQSGPPIGSIEERFGFRWGRP